MEKKKNTTRYTDQELEIIKGTFAENEELLKALRKHFLQMRLDPVDVELLKLIKGKILSVIRKTFLPELDGNANFHQMIDLWMTLEIKDKRPEEVEYLAIAREQLIRYIDQQLCLLENIVNPDEIIFSDLTTLGDKNGVEIYVDLTVRNTMIAHTEMMINQLFVLAGKKEESVDQTRERLSKDSNK